ncbi:NUDIX domain-containing protein [Planctomicrobium sp.]|jgi:isopentenyl-diphosphate Delta-isomerase|nr:NUDIX domain-containing protein [Planctomicrobium sp.]MBT5019001.1 NUDIX domain-containing protein [Planctomicrobium sp.]MDB4732948.1 NUDIX domain-containing protein [Planctomicrobium sp.]
MSEEIFDVCDADDNVIGQATRSEVHATGLLHRAVHIWVWRTDGRLMIHLRSATKDQYPLCYTSAASGHVDTGEDYETAAHRELQEELGLGGRLVFQTKLSASPATANEHTVLYFLNSDEEPTPDPNEIAKIEYRNPDELRQLIAREPEKLSPPFLSLLTEWYFASDVE